MAYVRSLDEKGSLEVRFDLACVLGTTLEMHVDAF